MAFSLAMIFLRSNGRAYYFLVFGGLFLVLNVVVPLIVNIWGHAYTIRWGENHKIADNDIYLIYSLYVFVAALFYLILSIIFNKRSEFKPGASIATKDLKGAQILIGAGILLGFLCYVYGTGMSLSELLVSVRFEWFADGSVSSLPLNIGLYLISLIPIYAFLDARLGFPNKPMSLAVYTVIVLIIMISGGRKWVIFLASGFLAGIFDRKGRVSFNLKYTVAIAAVILFMYVWQYGRNMAVDGASSFSQALYERSTDSGELFLRGDASYFYRASLEAIDLNYNHDVSYPGAIALRLILLPFPESWTFGLKPKGIPELFASDIGAHNSARSGNMPPGLIGLFALSFGSLFGVFVFSFIVPTMLIIAEMKRRQNLKLFDIVLAAHFVSLCTLLLRGSTGGIYYMIFGVFFTYFSICVIKAIRGLL